MISLSQKIKHILIIFNKWEYAALCLLIIMMLVMHFVTISTPKSLVFDEAYYVPAANNILHGVSLGRIEHPPLGQAIIATGIWIFGDNPLGWRFFSVIFGAISLILFYLICRKLDLSKYITFIATTFLALDNLSFTQAGTAMLDVFCLAFMFASVFCYLKKRPVWTGIFIGLATCTKLTGILVLLFILIYWLIINRKSIKMEIITIVTSGVSFCGSLIALDTIILHKLQNPISRITYMISYAKNLTFTSYIPDISGAIPSRPWEWLFHESITYNTLTHIWGGVYNSIVNPCIWILIIPIVLFLIYLTLKHEKPAIFALCWFAATYIIWIPISLFTNRLTYEYYFYPAVGSICIGIALLLSRIKGTHINIQVFKNFLRISVPLYMGITILFLIFIYSFGSIWFRMSWAAILFLIILYYLDRFQSLKTTPNNN